MSKMGLHDPFGHLQHNLWQKERSGVTLAVLLPTTKSRESTRPRACRWSATHHWKNLNVSYNFALDLIPIASLNEEL
jgi:hypothetical protein